MAVKSNPSWRLSSLMALAVAALSLPGMAQAAPDRDRAWGERVAHEDSPRQQRQEARQQRQETRQQSQAQRSWSPPTQSQAAAQAAPQSRWNGGQDRQGGESGARRGWSGGNRDENRSWATRAPQASPRAQQQQAVETGNTWRTRAERTPDRDRTARTERLRTRSGEAGVWQGTTAQREGQIERTRRQSDGVQSQTTRQRYSDRTRDGARSSNDGDWRSRVQRTDRTHSGDRNYWRSRDWSRHWDGSRRHRWSGWNNNWDWTWGNNYNRWNTRWRSNNRYDWYGWRSHHPSYFQVGLYYSPYRSYSYRRLSIGYFLDSLFFGEDYWIADPWYYRLPEAYGPYRWVRYYDDAVLVNIYSGEVADVIYSFFW